MLTRRSLLLVSLVAIVLSALVPAVASPAAATNAVRAAPSLSGLPAQSAATASNNAHAGAASPASARSAMAANILQKLRDAKVPMTAAYLPNFASQLRTSHGLVQPLYTVGPAPMGVGDFGVRNTTGTPAGYILQSRSWEGILNLNGATALYMDDGVPDWFGSQLNTVMTNTTVAGNTNNTFWIQNVIDYSTLTHSLTFIDNIWNFSNPSTAEPASTFYSFCPSGAGGPAGGAFYYCFGPTIQVPFPFSLRLFVNSSMTVNNGTNHKWSTVTFGYDVLNGAGGTIASGVYDTVLFNSELTAAATAPTPTFTVNGFTPNPAGLLDDAELMIGGPGGGSTTTIYAINGTEQLRYLSGTSYVNDPTAWNEGTDTGETVEGLSEWYAAAGTVHLSPGPSIPMPFWNATPTATTGEAILQGTVTPSNSFFWINQGAGFDPVQSAWAPVPASGHYSWALPPGSYFIGTQASEYLPNSTVKTLVAGPNAYNVRMTFNPFIGVYTPLWAWTNGQIANISSGGTGSAASPYLLLNNENGQVDPLYAQVNDYFYPVFSGIFLAYTNAQVSITQPPAFYVTYPSQYARGLAFFGYPNTNELSIQAYYASSITVWQGSFTGWFPYVIFGFPIYAPVANIGFWGVTNSLVGDSSFSDQGSAFLSAMGSNNVVWGNTFLNGPTLPSFYAGPYPFGIQIIESGDLIYNNYVATTFPGYEYNANFYSGAPEVHRDNWNLSGVEPASQVLTVNGHALSGSIVGSPWQCGNFWGNYVPGGPLPYNDTGFIQTGGDYCPYPIPTASVTFTETGLSAGTWSVSMGGITSSAAAGTSIVFAMPAGSWAYTVGAVPGLTAEPSVGVVPVAGTAQTIGVLFTPGLTAVLSPPSGAADVGQSVAFQATPSGGSGTYTYSWTFGDGATSTAQNPGHAFSTASTFTVNLWVNDTKGQTAHEQSSVTVNAAPVASASASKSTVDVGQSVTFTGSSTGGTGPVTLTWDFGDGSQSGASNPAHTFGTAGTYTVHLTAMDNVGVSSTATVTVTVNALPVATASASTSNPNAGDAVTFTASATGGTSPLSYAWSFGDGSTGTGASATHAFGTAGTYVVHLWVNDTAGGSSVTTLTVVVNPSGGVVSSGTTTIYSVAALVVGLVVGALVMFALKRRRKPEEPPQSSQPPSP